MFSFYN